MNTTIRGGALRQLYDSKTGNGAVPGFAGGGLIDKIKSVVGISSTPKKNPAPAPQNAPAPVLNIRKYAENSALDKRMKDADAMKTGGAIRGKGTGTSDDVPIMASNGEFMIKAKAVKKIGIEALEALNAIADTPGDKESKAEDRAEMPVKRHGGAIRKMSTGGLIDEDAVDRVNRLGATRASGGAVPTLKQIAAASAPSNAAQITASAAPAPTPAPTPSAPAQAAGGQMSYGDQMRNVGNFLVDAPVKAVKTVVSAPGYGFNSPDAPKPAPAETPPAAWGGESNRGAIRSEPALAIAQATEQIASGEMPKPSNQVTRVGNSYSGGPGITGDISLVDANGAPVRSGGAIRGLNNQAADNLAARYGQTSGFGTATSGGGTVSTVPGMSQDKINATLANPDGSQWSAQDNAIMQANIRDGVDPYRGTSRAKKQITMREYLANQGDATARRGQDINAGAIRGQQQIAQAKLDQESKLGAVDLQTKTNILKAQNALIAAKTPEERAAAEENFRALQGRYEKAVPNKFTVVPEFDANGQRTGTTVLDSEGKPVEIKKPTGQGQFEVGKVYIDAKGNRAKFDGEAFVPA